MTLWLYLHFPMLQLDSLYAEAKESPLVLVAEYTHRIVQHNQAASAQGIKNSIGLGSAAALCPDLQVHVYEPKAEHNTLLELAQWLYLVTSDIVLSPPQGLLLKASNMLTLYGDLPSYWQQIKQQLSALPVRYQFATGFSPLSAILLAKSSYNTITDNKEKMLTDLRRHPITASELTDKQVDALSRIGIQTFAELLDLPLQDIARRFDIELVNYTGRLLGQFKHPVQFYHPPQAFSSYLELLYEIDNLQWLEKPIQTLLNKLENYLIMRNFVGYELEISLHHREADPTKIRVTSAAGEYRQQRWSTLTQLTMESVQLDEAVQGITLNVLRCGELEATGKDMFSGHQGQQSELELVAMLQAKLGETQVAKIQYNHDPRPELASLLQDPTKPVSCSKEHSRLRPSLLLPTPIPLEEKVSLTSGPERIVTGWWDGHDVTRDYFIARSSQGRWLWVFRNQQKHWFIHGQFS
ncbi:Y-family DNA polymerase [Vibrio sonorensis]|uniref:Y-family DNA polymerase n=1 Tax=Vibrio sonorensis TaxID=1004316 RepID=UPI0008DAC921|nr:DNA polymerase Y family protein [Vibrio sonorensis]